MDRRTLLLLHVDEQVCDALMELEAAKKKKQTLNQLIQSLNSHTRYKTHTLTWNNHSKMWHFKYTLNIHFFNLNKHLTPTHFNFSTINRYSCGTFL